VTRSYRARWVFTGIEEPRRNAVLTITNDRIISITDSKAIVDFEFPNFAIIPGLVNAHTHLDLDRPETILPQGNTSNPVPWLEAVIASRQTFDSASLHLLIRRNLQMIIDSGCVLVGDISANGDSLEIVRSNNIEGICFHEILGLMEIRAKEFRGRFEHWYKDQSHDDSIGISPHAPYSTSRDQYEWASRQNLPLATHLAEFADELDLLSGKPSNVGRMLENRGIPEDLQKRQIAGWSEIISLDNRSRQLLVHANYLQPQPLSSTQSIVHCPRTHAYFGQPAFQFADWDRQGANIALGTDSLYSNPDLDVWQECCFLAKHRTDLSPSHILRLGTLNGAIAFGRSSDLGTIETGKLANLTLIRIDPDETDPWEAIFASPASIARGRFWRGELNLPKNDN
jgi:aminodeoxyfutalosine deaminase